MPNVADNVVHQSCKLPLMRTLLYNSSMPKTWSMQINWSLQSILFFSPWVLDKNSNILFFNSRPPHLDPSVLFFLQFKEHPTFPTFNVEWQTNAQEGKQHFTEKTLTITNLWVMALFSPICKMSCETHPTTYFEVSHYLEYLSKLFLTLQFLTRQKPLTSKDEIFTFLDEGRTRNEETRI